MKMNKKFIVFTLLVMLILSMSTTVFAEDIATSNGGINGTDAIVTGDGVGIPTDDSIDTPTKNDAGDNKIIMPSRTAAPGLDIKGAPNTYKIEKSVDTYKLTVTGGPITISMGEEPLDPDINLLNIDCFGDTNIIFDNVDLSGIRVQCLGDVGTVNLKVIGTFKFKSGSFVDKLYPGENKSNYIISGENGAQLDPTGALDILLKSFTMENIELKGDFFAIAEGATFNNINFSNTNLYINKEYGGASFIQVENNLSFNNCYGNMNYKYLDRVVSGIPAADLFSAIVAGDLDVKMEKGKSLGIKCERMIYPMDAGNGSLYVSALSIKNAPTLKDTDIVNPVNGSFIKGAAPLDSYNAYDSKGAIADTVVFAGPSEDKDPIKTDDKNPIKTDDTGDKTQKAIKTSDAGQPWMFVALAVLALMAFAWFMNRKVKD